MAIALLVLLGASAHATLVAVVPARDGLAIASDSRFTFMGAPCDGAFKIVEPERPLRTVAFVTGDSIFVAPPPAGEDPCRYLATAPRLLDVGAVVKAYLGRGGEDPAGISNSDLATDSVDAVERFRQRYPNVLKSYAGREIFSVVVVSYDPASEVSTLRNFVVRMDARGRRVQAARMGGFCRGTAQHARRMDLRGSSVCEPGGLRRTGAAISEPGCAGLSARACANRSRFDRRGRGDSCRCGRSHHPGCADGSTAKWNWRRGSRGDRG